jgi:hypothetical protein
MVDLISVCLLAVAFTGAGIVNALGVAGTRANLVRWGYPHWWCHVTGALEIAAAVLIALPATRLAGLILGTVIVGAAVLTVLRHHDYSHLAPLGLFAALLALGFAL